MSETIVTTDEVLAVRPDDTTEAAEVTSRRSIPWVRVLMALSTLLFAISHIWKYWELRLNAPQYPGGLFVSVYTHDVRGDVGEVDGLNHYIGMKPLAQAAEFERMIAPYAIAIFIIMGVAAIFLRRRWAPLMLIPIILFPIVVFVDLYVWLYYFGHSLDPTAALSGAIEEFTPAILGRGVVGQFTTDAAMGPGWWVSVAAAIAAMAAIVINVRKSKGTD